MAVSLPEQPTQYAPFTGTRGFRSYYQLGQISEKFLDYDEALRFYLACLQDNSHFTVALEKLVHILDPRGNPQDAKDSLENVFDFSTPSSQQLIGEICFQEGAYSLALEYFSRSIQGIPPSPGIMLHQAICLMQQRRYLEALRTIDQIPQTVCSC